MINVTKIFNVSSLKPIQSSQAELHVHDSSIHSGPQSTWAGTHVQ